jgi:flagellar hook-length control protein FliK
MSMVTTAMPIQPVNAGPSGKSTSKSSSNGGDFASALDKASSSGSTTEHTATQSTASDAKTTETTTDGSETPDATTAEDTAEANAEGSGETKEGETSATTPAEGSENTENTEGSENSEGSEGSAEEGGGESSKETDNGEQTPEAELANQQEVGASGVTANKTDAKQGEVATQTAKSGTEQATKSEGASSTEGGTEVGTEANVDAETGSQSGKSTTGEDGKSQRGQTSVASSNTNVASTANGTNVSGDVAASGDVDQQMINANKAIAGAEVKTTTVAEANARPTGEVLNVAQTGTARTADGVLATAAGQPLNPGTDPGAPMRQVVSLLTPLRHNGDGEYRLMLQLRPEQLGRVDVQVTLNNGQVSIHLLADNAASRQMLRDHMPELRDALADAGLDAGSLDVGDHDTQDKSTTNSGGSAQLGDVVADADEDEFFARLQQSPSMNQAATDGPLDVRI